VRKRIGGQIISKTRAIFYSYASNRLKEESRKIHMVIPKAKHWPRLSMAAGDHPFGDIPPGAWRVLPLR
jgi:hypothetical protein